MSRKYWNWSLKTVTQLRNEFMHRKLKPRHQQKRQINSRHDCHLIYSFLEVYISESMPINFFFFCGRTKLPMLQLLYVLICLGVCARVPSRSRLLRPPWLSTAFRETHYTDCPPKVSRHIQLLISQAISARLHNCLSTAFYR